VCEVAVTADVVALLAVAAEFAGDADPVAAGAGSAFAGGEPAFCCGCALLSSCGACEAGA